MGHGVDSCDEADHSRHGHEELRIQNCRPESGVAAAAGHLAVLGRGGDESVRLRFAARAGRRRNADRREKRAVGLPHALVVLHTAAIREDEVDAFGGIHRAAAADCHDRVGAMLLGDRDARVHDLRRRILRHVIEHPRRAACRVDRFGERIDVTDLPNARVRHEQRAFQLQLRQDPGQLGPNSGPEHDLCRAEHRRPAPGRGTTIFAGCGVHTASAVGEFGGDGTGLFYAARRIRHMTFHLQPRADRRERRHEIRDRDSQRHLGHSARVDLTCEQGVTVIDANQNRADDDGEFEAAANRGSLDRDTEPFGHGQDS